MSNAIFISLIIAAAVVIIFTLILLLRWLKPKNNVESDNSGGVRIDDNPLLSLTGEIKGRSNFHKGTIVINEGMQRIKVSIYNCRIHTEQTFNITRELIIAREPKNPVYDPNVYYVTGDHMVSAIHCRLINYAGTGSLAVQDDGSSNHTYLNGAMVEGIVYVNNGDCLTVGQTELIIKIL